MEKLHKMMIHLWFDTQAAEAADFYLNAFENSRRLGRTSLRGTPSGEVDVHTLEIEDLHLMLISAGPAFRINPAVSFMVSLPTREAVRSLWDALSEGGQALMPLDRYDFSEYYGWIEDRFGVSWQIMHTGDRPIRTRIRPTLMFAGPKAGRAEEAVRFYGSVFGDSDIGMLSRYGENAPPPNTPEMLNYSEFVLGGQGFAAMDSAYTHDFDFNEAVSILVNCDTQEEIDRLTDELSADPEAEQCGWVRDRFGVSWQLSPTALSEWMHDADPEAVARLTQALLRMKRLDIAALEAAYRGA